MGAGQWPLSDTIAVVGRDSNEEPFLAEPGHWCSVRSNVRVGSTADIPKTWWKRPLLRGKRTSEVCFLGPVQCSTVESAVGGRADIPRLAWGIGRG